MSTSSGLSETWTVEAVLGQDGVVHASCPICSREVEARLESIAVRALIAHMNEAHKLPKHRGH